jgi:YrbI family 3-deoxy-D-manno-octulosonate 8-phosphate phosphatase
MTPASLNKKAASISLLLFDCDGVLTDGGIYVTPEGEEMRRFDVHDGYGITMLQAEGVRVGLVTGKDSGSTIARGEYLKFDPIRAGRFDKGKAVEEILEETGLPPDKVAYVGDDVFDIPAMKIVGLALSVANARTEVKKIADYVTKASGGHGAAREIAEMIIEARRSAKAAK